jgi:hypothetical protein
MNRSQFYALVDGKTQFSASDMNPRLFDIDSRLGALETMQPSLAAAIADLTQLGIARINDALLPAFNQITNIQTLGFLSAPIATGSNAIFATGATAVTISAAYAGLFKPPPWVVLVRAANATDYLIAQVLSYDSTTGGLSLVVTNQVGVAGTYTDVYVIGCPGGALAAIDSAAQVLSARADVLAAKADVDANVATVASDMAAIASVAAGAGVASVNGRSGTVTGVQDSSAKDQPNGYAGLNSSGQIVASELPIGLANGVAGLDGGGKVPTTQLPASVLGALNFQGSWNAAANTPTLASGVGTKGYYYKVSTAGSTVLNGVSQWNVGDLVAFNGTTWDKFDGLPSEVTSVAGRTGAVTLSTSDVSGLAPSATTDATNASNISTGTLPAARGGAGSVNGIMKANGSGAVSAATAGTDYLAPGATATIMAGFGITPNSAGTKSSGTFTPDPTVGNYQYATNNGAHTLAAPANDCALTILYTNGASAGAITFSGFTVSSNTGDALTTTNTSKFIISIIRINSVSTYIIKALQ